MESSRLTLSYLNMLALVSISQYKNLLFWLSILRSWQNNDFSADNCEFFDWEQWNKSSSGITLYWNSFVKILFFRKPNKIILVPNTHSVHQSIPCDEWLSSLTSRQIESHDGEPIFLFRKEIYINTYFPRIMACAKWENELKKNRPSSKTSTP